MGNACSGVGLSATEKAEIAKSKAIEETNKKSFEVESQKIKLLLLGTGESGKSTLFKQMRILYGVTKGFTDQERSQLKEVIYSNILQNIKQLLMAHAEKDGENVSMSQEFKEILNIEEKVENIDNELARKMATFWKDEKIKKIWEKRGQLQIQVQDSLEYYMKEENLPRLCSPNYIPSDQDILRSRVRTSGIVEEEFMLFDSRFLLVDVGGQRNERRKWIHAFEDVDCVIFVAAISEFDQVLYEDQHTNRQDESVNLFRKIVNEPCFKNNGLILFLNKRDLLREKLRVSKFRDVSLSRNINYVGAEFRSGMSESDLDEVLAQTVAYLEALYRSVVPKGRQVYVQTTCATDTKQMEHVMNACKDVFLKRNLQAIGFM